MGEEKRRTFDQIALRAVHHPRRAMDHFVHQLSLFTQSIRDEAHSSKELATPLVDGVAFTPDGRLLASASDDRTVRVWNAASGQQLRALQGHTGGVTSVAFSPDSKRLASRRPMPIR
jgi:WD40 repeat protein